MKKYFKYTLFLLLFPGANGCSDAINEDNIGYNYDITLNEIEVDRFSFKIPNGPFKAGDSKSGVVTFNVVKSGNDIEGGFVISNKNWRSYPWCLSEDFNAAGATDAMRKAALDSCRFSVYTNRGNTTQTYAVAKVKGDLAFFTLDKPDVIEHILVANTTYNYLLMVYGSYYTSQLDPVTQFYVPFTFTNGVQDPTKPAKVSNPKIPETTAKGRFSLPTPDGKPIMHFTGMSNLIKEAVSHASAEANRAAGADAIKIYEDSVAARASVGAGWFKIIIKGYLDGRQTGKIDYYMGARTNAVTEYPKLNTIKDNWYAVDLTPLGKVDKVVFNIDASDKDENGTVRMPPYFCIDGIRLQGRDK